MSQHFAKLKVSGKAKRSTSDMLAQMERELEQARQEARITRDEMQTFQEEARCANEEMQSMNEELQSTNEELQMLNHELSAKVNDLSRLNNDMKNLLDSTELTTLFLDNALNVRLFTTGSNKIFKLMRGDVGRPITDIASDLDFTRGWRTTRARCCGRCSRTSNRSPPAMAAGF